MLSDHDRRWFAARLSIAVYDTNREYRMSVEVKGLAETVRKAKTAISKASDVSSRMQTSAARLTETLGQVEDMTKQLDDAQAELQGVVGQLSNGGPPLDQPSPSSQHLEKVLAEVAPSFTDVQTQNPDLSAMEPIRQTPSGAARSVAMLNAK